MQKSNEVMETKQKTELGETQQELTVKDEKELALFVSKNEL